MLKTFFINQAELKDTFYPSFYLFKKRIDKMSNKKDLTSFSLGDDNTVEVMTDGEHAGQVFVESGATFIKNSYVKRFNVSEFEETYISALKNNKLKRSQLEKGDVLFTTIGNLGIASVVNQNLVNANINQNVIRLRINKEKTNPYYLSCFLNSKIAKFQVENLFTGNIYPILTYPKIKSIKIFIKNKEIENNVTNLLIEAEKYHLESLKLIEKAQSLFKKELNVDFDKISDDMFYSIDKDYFYNQKLWTPAYFKPIYSNILKLIKENNNVKLLTEVAKIKKGNEVGSANYKGYLDKKETDIPFVRTSDFVNYEIDKYPDFYIDNDIYDELDQDIKSEDLVFTNDGKIGLIAMITKNDKCILQSHIKKIRCFDINPYYLFIVLSIKEIGLYQSKRFTVVQSTIPTIGDNLKNFEIPIIENQDEIIKLTKKAFELKDKKKVLIENAKELLEESLDF